MAERDGGPRLSTAEVARRLDVKAETVYAYVSRGLLNPERTAAGSRFAQDEVDALATRRHAGRRPSGSVERIRTGLTLLDGDQLYYRGHRVAELAGTHTLEAVARLLWTGTLEPEPFEAPADRVELASAATEPLPARARLTEHVQVGVAALGAADPLRFDVRPEPVTAAVRGLLAAVAEALPGHAAASAAGGVPTLAERLWPKLTAAPVDAGLLDTALVLLADNGLAASTIAARVAASARANIYAVLFAGLGAADGYQHGAASTLAYRFLAEAVDDPVAALSERLRAGDSVPGFGHRVYERSDPRATVLLGRLPDHPVLAVVDRLRRELADRADLFANVDLALAAMSHACGMRPDAGELVFAFARIVGWTAHALEEYGESGLRFRPLGVYTGPRR